MTTGKSQIFKIDRQDVELVEYYTFLGSTVTKGKSAISKLERILKDKNVTKKTKIKIAETLVFPIVTMDKAGFSTTSALGEISTAPPNCISNPYEKRQRI